MRALILCIRRSQLSIVQRLSRPGVLLTRCIRFIFFFSLPYSPRCWFFSEMLCPLATLTYSPWATFFFPPQGHEIFETGRFFEAIMSIPAKFLGHSRAPPPSNPGECLACFWTLLAFSHVPDLLPLIRLGPPPILPTQYPSFFPYIEGNPEKVAPPL